MKILFYISSLLLLGCSGSATSDFSITGTTKPDMEGAMVILKQDGKDHDTAFVKNGHFSLQGKLKNLALCEVKLSGAYPDNAEFAIMMSKKKPTASWMQSLKIFVEEGKFYKLNINGIDEFLENRFHVESDSPYQGDFTNFRLRELDLRNTIKADLTRFETIRTLALDKGDMVTYGNYTDSIRLSSDIAQKRYTLMVKKYMKERPDTYQTLQLLKGVPDLYNDQEFYMAIYHKLSPKLKDRTEAEIFIHRVDQLNKINHRGFKVEIVGADRNNKPFDIKNFADKKMLVIDLWASWCKPCLNEMSAAKRMQKEFSDDNIAYIFVSIDENEQKWKQADSTLSLEESYAIKASALAEFKRKLDITSIPRYLIVNNRGELLESEAPAPSRPELLFLTKKISGQMTGK